MHGGPAAMPGEFDGEPRRGHAIRITTGEMGGALSRGACVGEDPRLFDAINETTGKVEYAMALRALSICSGCQIPDACNTAVRPQRSSFDGVAAGKVWRNGYQVQPNNHTREDRFTTIRERFA